MKNKKMCSVLYKELRTLFEINPVYFLERLSGKKANLIDRYHIKKMPLLYNEEAKDKLFNEYIKKVLAEGGNSHE